MDSEWLLGLSEDEQLTVAEVASSQEHGAGVEKELMERLYKLLAGGVRGTASGAFERDASESPACTDSDTEQDGTAHADGRTGPGSHFEEL